MVLASIPSTPTGLANLLSTYIDDLQHVAITFDDGETAVNGTASVYRKKVEFLWQMLLQTLDMLRSKKGEEEGEGGGQT